MKPTCVLSDYLTAALELADYQRLTDGFYSGRIPICTGVVAFGPTLTDCQWELRSTLEDWLLLGLKLGHSLPVVGTIDLNQEPQGESVESVQTP